jgi:hypothetical protein
MIRNQVRSLKKHGALKAIPMKLMRILTNLYKAVESQSL